MKKTFLFLKYVQTILTLVCLMFAFPGFAMITPNDEYFGEQWYLQKIQAPETWGTTTGLRSVVVAVLDTGVDQNHPDIVPNIWTNDDEISGDGIDNDNNGYVDDVHGYDFVDIDADPEPNLQSSKLYWF